MQPPPLALTVAWLVRRSVFVAVERGPMGYASDPSSCMWGLSALMCLRTLSLRGSQHEPWTP